MKLSIRKKQKLLFSLVWLFSLTAYVNAQSVNVTGKVTSSDDGSPIIGASIVVKGTNIGVATDFDGNYSIEATSAESTLIFSYIGYLTQEIKLGGKSVVDVTLQTDVTKLDDVVVVGYGSQSSATVTSAIVQVTSEDIEDIPTNTVSSVLQGKLPGVQIKIAGSAQPGNDLGITIRGGSSISRNDSPLILVDGFPRTLQDINPQDIATVSVLKDAASTAIYGARASNGVVLVTTKRGRTGKPNIGIHYSTGLQRRTHEMEQLNARDYLTTIRTYGPNSVRYNPADYSAAQAYGTGNDEDSPYTTRLLQSGESVPAGYQSMTDPLTGGTLIFKNQNMMDVLFRDAYQKNLNLSVNGGNDKALYAIGLGLADQEGIGRFTGYERYTGSAKLDVQATDNLKLNVGFDYSNSNINSYLDERTTFFRSMATAPTFRVFDSNGDPNKGWTNLGSNIYYTQAGRTYDRQRSNLALSAGASWSIGKHFTATFNANYFERHDTSDFFERARPTYYQDRTAFAKRDKINGKQYESLLNYKQTFNEVHNVEGLIGYSFLENGGDLVGVFGRNAASNNIPTLNAAVDLRDMFSYRYNEKLVGQFGQIRYNYDYKYLLSASLRRDGSSRFGADNQYGLFPSASVGWVASKESFLEDTLVSYLKLRSSYGVTGNNDFGNSSIGGITISQTNGVGRSSFPSLYIAGGQFDTGYDYAGNGGISPTAIPNQALKWESTAQFDVGLDLGLFENRKLNIAFDYWTKNTKDLLFSELLPYETGFNSIQKNLGEVKYWGVDLAIDGLIIDNDELRWDASFNIGTTNNEVVKLPSLEGVDRNRIGSAYSPAIIDADGTGVGGYAEGERIDKLLGYVKDFIIDNQAQADAALFDAIAAGYDPSDGTSVQGRKFPGDVEWVDRNGDNRIDGNDRDVIGYAIPDVNGGFRTAVEYKGFELTVFMDFAMGHSIQDETRTWLNTMPAPFVNPTTDVLKAWKQTGDASGGYPRIDVADHVNQDNWFRSSTINTYKGDYLCLRDVRLSYKFPSKVIDKLKLSNGSIYLAGNTLAYFTKYPGYSPEFGGRRSQFSGGYYPAATTIMLGLKMNL